MHTSSVEEYRSEDKAYMLKFYKKIRAESPFFHPYNLKLDSDKFNDPTRFKYHIKQGDIVAHVTFYGANDDYFVGVAVLASNQRAGLATMLLRFAEAKVRSLGGKRMIANIEPDNRASLNLFTKNGYRICRDEYPIVMEKIL